MNEKKDSTAKDNDRNSPQSPEKKSYFQEREDLRLKSKLEIARSIVTDFLHEGDSILLDAGTSLCPIATEIAERAQRDPASTHYTIMTHNYKAFQILVDRVPKDANMNIVLAGGRYDIDLNALFGPQAIRAYDHFFPRVVLIGISGMVADSGLFCHGNTEELTVKEVIFKKSARDRIIVADYTKLGVPDALRFGSSPDLCANVDSCFLVTDEPGSTADRDVRERFLRETERLSTKYSVKVKSLKID